MPKQPTTPSDLSRINSMFEAMSTPLSLLAERWSYEHKYEDIEDYGKVIAARLPEGITLVNMMRRPFGFTFTIGTDALYRMTVSKSTIEWKRIA